MSELVIRPEPFSSGLAQRLAAEVNAVYVERYGGPDDTPIELSEFDPASGGRFLVGFLDGAAVACGGFRRAEPPAPPGTAELKRMYVTADRRRCGLGRRMLTALEVAAAQASYTRVILDTGTAQPEAIGLYLSSGYTRIPNYSIYRHHATNRAYAKTLAVRGAAGNP